MLRFDGVLELLECGDRRRSDFHVTRQDRALRASGLRRSRGPGLRRRGRLDDVDPERHDSCAGTEAHSMARPSTGPLSKSGDIHVREYVRHARHREGERLERYFDLTKRLGVGFIEMLEPRPCGGFLRPRTRCC